MFKVLSKLILIIALVINFYTFPVFYYGDDLYAHMSEKLYYNRMYAYDSISFGKFYVCFPHIYNFSIPRGHSLEFSRDDMSNLGLIVETLTHIPYVEDQSNPKKVFTDGGNCMAVTLLAKAYLDIARIPNTLIVTETHMYNQVIVDGITYDLDIVNDILEEVE